MPLCLKLSIRFLKLFKSMTEITIRAPKDEIDGLVKRVRQAIPELPKTHDLQDIRQTLKGIEIIRIFVLK